MTALAKPRQLTERLKKGGAFPVAAGVKIYPGAWVALVAGYLRPAGASTGTLTGRSVASAVVDNTTGADGDVSCDVQFPRDKILHRFVADPGNSLSQANVGGPAYFLDDQTTTPVAANHGPAGTLWDFGTANGVQVAWIDVSDTAAAALAALAATDVTELASIASLAAAQAWTPVSGAFVIGAGNYDVDVTSAPASAPFPSSPAPGEVHLFKVNAASTNNFTLSRAGSQTIERLDGAFANTFVFSVDRQELGFFFETATSRWRLL